MVDLVDVRCECVECGCDDIVVISSDELADYVNEVVVCEDCLDGLHKTY